jgi:Icc-related predicted phosphoesterase
VGVLEELGVSLHARKVVVAGRTFVGIGGSNPTPFGMPFELTEEEILDALQRLMEPDAIVVSHPPPRGYVDVAHLGRHVGSTALRQVIEAYAPPLVLCGHIHEARGVARHGPTTIVNAGAAKSGHRALVEIDGDVKVQLL